MTLNTVVNLRKQKSINEIIGDVFVNEINKNPKHFIDASDRIDAIIVEEEMEFSGRKLPFSIKPLIITEEESKYFKIVSELILNSLEKLLEAYKHDEEIKEFFSYYKQFEKLISIDPGYNKKIRIARFDTIWYGSKDFKILESNTCCPGGIVILGRLKERYLEIPFIKNIFKNYNNNLFLCDSQTSFIKELVKAYREKGGIKDKPNIAFANYNGNYNYELLHMKKFAFEMGINSVICDLRDLKVNDDRLFYEDFEIDIIYNKVDQLELGKEDINDVLEAIRSNYVCSVNSFISMFIGESKMTLALLTDKKFQLKYLNTQEIEAINKHVPWTRKLEDGNSHYNDEKINLIEYSLENKNQLVLKVDNETRGSNIFIGKITDVDTWSKLIHDRKNINYIIQEYCEIPQVNVPIYNGENTEFVDRKFGIDMFMFGGEFAGVVSRISEKDIINVGQGGYEQPVIEITE